METMGKRDEQINMRVSEDEKQMILSEAVGENRSVTNFLIWLVKRFRKAKGKKTATPHEN
jgi:uncharacterized protein (DUF1778 family)